MRKVLITLQRGLVTGIFIDSKEECEVFIVDEGLDGEKTSAEEQLGLLDTRNMKRIF